VYYKELSGAVAKKKALQPGNTAPDFTLKKPDSSSFTLSSLRGRYVILDFWASWCVPCRKAIPHWKEVYKKYNAKGLEMVSVTNDSRWSDWFKALDVEKMPWLQVADEFPIKNMPARVATLYMIPYLPTYVLLDKEGKIVLHNASEEQMDEKLKEIFGS
jgi:thiol-disulfide isomerase/thioredoxin